MSSKMFRGLMACLEPRLDEPSIFHSHSFTEKKYQEQEKISKSETNSEGDYLGGWSFIQIRKQGNETEQLYVHPLVKKSSLGLSSKSLEMCTEGLGTETGCNIVENIDELLERLNKNHDIHISKLPKIVKKANRTVRYPPPLKSIIGSNGVQVRPYREPGRLVLKAVSNPSTIGSFQVERGDGKLRISFTKNGSDEVHADEELEKSSGNNGIGDVDDCHDDSDGDIEQKIEFEIEVGNHQRQSRCKGGDRKQAGDENFGWLFHEQTCLLELKTLLTVSP